MRGIPDDLPVIERRAVRLVVLDADRLLTAFLAGEEIDEPFELWS
ncbi:hypothetical protein [Micromonospora sp. RTGN7]|nr:hypothetical protein [Micromonospora sp. RTGN7]